MPRKDIAYLGPPGTYSELVARKQFGAKNNFVPLPSIHDVCTYVAKDPARRGIVPIENSSGAASGNTRKGSPWTPAESRPTEKRSLECAPSNNTCCATKNSSPGTSSHAWPFTRPAVRFSLPIARRSIALCKLPARRTIASAVFCTRSCRANCSRTSNNVGDQSAGPRSWPMFENRRPALDGRLHIEADDT